jgi:hypothetical protein
MRASSRIAARRAPRVRGAAAHVTPYRIMRSRAPAQRSWRVHSIYRFGIWLPLLVPTLLAIATRGAGVVVVHDSPAGKLTQLLLSSLLYGGVPYGALAIWATWWIGDRPESGIRHLMFRAPLLMAALFMLFAVAIGLTVGEPRSFIALGVLGAIITIPLGYA